jgi:hypothetical protein
MQSSTTRMVVTCIRKKVLLQNCKMTKLHPRYTGMLIEES